MPKEEAGLFGAELAAPDPALTALRSEFRHLVRNLATGSDRCKSCNEAVWFLKYNSGNTVPHNVSDGRNHFKTCPNAAHHSRKEQHGKPEAESDLGR